MCALLTWECHTDVDVPHRLSAHESNERCKLSVGVNVVVGGVGQCRMTNNHKTHYGEIDFSTSCSPKMTSPNLELAVPTFTTLISSTVGECLRDNIYVWKQVYAQ